MKPNSPAASRSPLARGLLACMRSIKRRVESWRSPESVFTEIYRKQIWGGDPGGIFSGGGSRDSKVAGAYLEMLGEHARDHPFHELDFVDLGCGDMEIGRRLIPFCRNFTGLDVVGFVIDHHREEMGGGHVRFLHLDIVDGELPAGDVCFVRQVFQHLSNRQVAEVLPKLRKYRRIYITEHVPSAGLPWIPNTDKPQGAGIRLNLNSGIDITAAPFLVPCDEVRTVLEVLGNEIGVAEDPGIIRTVLYTPGCGNARNQRPVVDGGDGK